MSKTGPIVLIDDDQDDMEIFRSALGELNVNNELVWFSETKSALSYLKHMPGQPFLIISDINLPVQNGIDFKKAIEKDLQLKCKCIPFLFYSTSVDKYVLSEVYADLTVQGFFRKEDSFTKIKDRIEKIIGYWMQCEHPANN